MYTHVYVYIYIYIFIHIHQHQYAYLRIGQGHADVVYMDHNQVHNITITIIHIIMITITTINNTITITSTTINTTTTITNTTINNRLNHNQVHYTGGRLGPGTCINTHIHTYIHIVW